MRSFVLMYVLAAIGIGLPQAVRAQGLEFNEVPLPGITAPKVFGPYNAADVQKLRNAGVRVNGPIPVPDILAPPSAVVASRIPGAAGREQRVFLKRAGDEPFTPEQGTKFGFISKIEIDQPGAAWLKVKFRRFDIGDALLHISSTRINRLQTLDRDSLKEWSWYSAIFPGDSLTVEMFVKPDGKIPKGLTLQSLIESVIKGSSLTAVKPYPDTLIAARNSEQSLPPPESYQATEEGICQVDKRAFASDKRVARMRPAGCTVFILKGGVFATAGHCTRVNLEKQQVEFNVEHSSSLGTMKDATPDNMYPVDISTLRCGDCDRRYVETEDEQFNLPHGTDWALFRLHMNSETRARAEDRQGAWFEIPQDVDALLIDRVSSVAVLGYGDDDDPAEARHALQSGIGNYHGVEIVASRNIVRVMHEADTRKGNSGSPILARGPDGGTEYLVGIHTGGDCAPDADKLNSGTSILHPDFIAAYRELTGLAPGQ